MVENAVPNSPWAGGINDEIGMVKQFSRLGFVVPEQNAAGDTVFVESERDPGFPR
jgi:hypothetical protein